MKTTKQDYEIFKAACIEWQKKLSLTNWKLYFKHEAVDGSYATTMWSMEDSIAVIRLAFTWDKERPKTKYEINQLALHEVLHLLLAEYCSAAEARYSTQSALDIAEHSIIRRLEYLLCESQ